MFDNIHDSVGTFNNYWLGKYIMTKSNHKLNRFLKLTCTLLISAVSAYFWYMCIYVWHHMVSLPETKFGFTYGITALLQ